MNVDDDEKNDTFVQNSLLQIQNLKTMLAKNRFRKSQNRNKLKTTKERKCAKERQRIFDNFTRRKFSRFEYTEIIDFISSVQISSNQSSFNQSSFSQSSSNQSSTFMRSSSTQFIRSSTFYFEFSMYESFVTSYFQQSFQFNFSFSIQFFSNQMYNQ